MRYPNRDKNTVALAALYVRTTKTLDGQKKRPLTGVILHSKPQRIVGPGMTGPDTGMPRYVDPRIIGR